ncbi:hypothetical protein HWV62_17870 [Athelia sp. TMB]|nr:hypothetical protein HWV62_17870 [Athelia sp. TMB]
MWGVRVQVEEVEEIIDAASHKILRVAPPKAKFLATGSTRCSHILTPLDMSTKCTGCEKYFTQGTYLRHIRTSAEPRCHAIYNNIHNYLPGGEGDSGSDTQHDHNPSMEPEYSIDAGGDYFGDYQDEDFGWQDEPAGEDLGDPQAGFEGHEYHEDDEEDDDEEEEEEEVLPLPNSSPASPNRASVPPPVPNQQEYVTKFGGLAGTPLLGWARGTLMYNKYQHETGNALWGAFQSRIDWEFARWAKLRGPSSTAVSDLLNIDGLHEKLGLSYKNSRELNQMIDRELPSRPRFVRDEVAGETFDFYRRDIMPCIEALYGDPDFAPHLKFAPERYYADPDQTIRVYHDMETGNWWWKTQKAIEALKPGATIIPIILSTDKTQVTLFRNKSAYPIYMTIGNIPKSIRRKPSCRGYILLGYLPTTRLEKITNKAARRRTIANLFHSCMRRVTSPLKDAGITGRPMASGDGVVRRTHPIFATFVGDYPEQLLVTGIKTGECPKCPMPRDELGEYDGEVPELRDLDAVLNALAAIDIGPAEFTKACREAGIKPLYHPFWEDLPFVHIFRSISPDILHQLYQGIIKHLTQWIKDIYGADEIDARCTRFPPNHNIRDFKNGIFGLSRVSGKEHDQICRILLGIVVDIPLPDGMSSIRLVRAVRASLDFLYFAQYPLHTDETLGHLEDALQRFHNNKDIFIDLGIRNNFNIPKLHFAQHYVQCIKEFGKDPGQSPMTLDIYAHAPEQFLAQALPGVLFGTSDNYNTEYTERLHIDLAKDAYRATNHKDEFAQMTIWLERKEKILRHESYIHWQQSHLSRITALPPRLVPRRLLQMAKHPSAKSISFERLAGDYGAVFFRDALARYIVGILHPTFNRTQIERASGDIFFHSRAVSVFHRIKFATDADGVVGKTPTSVVDSIHITPSRKDSRGRGIPARFDTALVTDGTESKDLKDFRVCQVRVAFTLSGKALESLFPQAGPQPPKHLAYVEWFSPFADRDHASGLYRLSRSLRDGQRLASVIPVSNIVQSIHLYPQFGARAPREWTSANVLDMCPVFFTSPFADRQNFVTIS